MSEPDTVEALLEIVTGTNVGWFDIGFEYTYSGPSWTALAYYFGPEEDGGYEIEVTAPTLREALCAIIAHPRFGQ